MIGEDTGRDDDPPLPMQFNRFRCWSLHIYINVLYRGYSLGCYDPALVNPILLKIYPGLEARAADRIGFRERTKKKERHGRY